MRVSTKLRSKPDYRHLWLGYGEVPITSGSARRQVVAVVGTFRYKRTTSSHKVAQACKSSRIPCEMVCLNVFRDDVAEHKVRIAVGSQN